MHTETGQQADGGTDSDQVQQQRLSGSAAQSRPPPAPNRRNRLPRAPKLKQKRRDERLPSLPESGLSSRRNVGSFAAKVFVEEMDEHDTTLMLSCLVQVQLAGSVFSCTHHRTVCLQPSQNAVFLVAVT